MNEMPDELSVPRKACVTCVPFLPSVSMMREWMRRRLEGYEDGEAWHEVMRGCRPRTWSRREIAGARRQGPVMLSLPIAGGSSVVKNRPPATWLISAHGDWQRVFAGAIEAAYGLTPFFEHVYPHLRLAIDSAFEGEAFPEFTNRLHLNAVKTMGLENLIKQLRESDVIQLSRLRTLADEKFKSEYADLAFLDVIFRKGPESIFTLLSNSD